MITRSHIITFSLLIWGCLPQCELRAAAPLHERIDALVGVGQAEFDESAAAVVDDAAFLRRAYLDLIGRIPSAQQVRAFLADEEPDKRARVIAGLLTSPEHARHMQYVFDTMLMERRPAKNITAKQWQDYLRQGFLRNKHWDQLVTEILTADGTDPKTRAAARFLLDRELKTDEVTRDLGRVFLGRDLQCAQCHDHPNIDGYLQRHYHGLSAFLNRSYVFKDPKTKQASIGEKAEGDVEFTSVFTNETDKTPPRMLDLPAIPDPPAAKQPYVVKPAKNVRSVPVHSRRLQLSAAMTDDSNRAFRMNIANRLWALMMGKGIVEPVDLWHDENPPSHPELLDLLADELQQHDFDMRYLLQELALTKTYQRSSLLESPPPAGFGTGMLKPLSAEQLAWSMMQATGLTQQTLKSLQQKQAKSKKPEDAAQADDPHWQEQALHDALQAHVTTFVTTFGVQGIQTSRFDASADQALFLRNGELVQGWLKVHDDRLSGRLAKLDNAAAPEELYLSVFSRLPDQQEQQQITQYLNAAGEKRDQAIGPLIWAALTSAEFRFNH